MPYEAKPPIDNLANCGAGNDGQSSAGYGAPNGALSSSYGAPSAHSAPPPPPVPNMKAPRGPMPTISNSVAQEDSYGPSGNGKKKKFSIKAL